MASSATTHPISDRTKITRERVFALSGSRPDFMDVVAQFVFALEKMHRERVTGRWEINWSDGGIQNSKLIELVK